MKKSELEHVLRAASELCDDTEFIIIGSQSLHGRYPDMADAILMSYEVDIFAKNRTDNTEHLNAIGNYSPFHELYGYYADPVSERTAVLPRKWRERLVHLKLTDPELKVKAYCLDPHDLVVSKLAAGREKDTVFIRELLAKGLVDYNNRGQTGKNDAYRCATAENGVAAPINRYTSSQSGRHARCAVECKTSYGNAHRYDQGDQ